MSAFSSRTDARGERVRGASCGARRNPRDPFVPALDRNLREKTKFAAALPFEDDSAVTSIAPRDGTWMKEK
jgi:hypothetical protein